MIQSQTDLVLTILSIPPSTQVVKQWGFHKPLAMSPESFHCNVKSVIERKRNRRRMIYNHPPKKLFLYFTAHIFLPHLRFCAFNAAGWRDITSFPKSVKQGFECACHMNCWHNVQFHKKYLNQSDVCFFSSNAIRAKCPRGCMNYPCPCLNHRHTAIFVFIFQTQRIQ